MANGHALCHLLKLGMEIESEGCAELALCDLLIELVLKSVKIGAVLLVDIALKVCEDTEVCLLFIGICLDKLFKSLTCDKLCCDGPAAVNIFNTENLGDIKSCILDSHVVGGLVKNSCLAVGGDKHLHTAISVTVDHLLGSLCKNVFKFHNYSAFSSVIGRIENRNLRPFLALKR